MKSMGVAPEVAPGVAPHDQSWYDMGQSEGKHVVRFEFIPSL